MRYLDREDQWNALATAINRATEAGDPVGIDSETDGQDQDQSPQYRAQVVVFSVGLLGQSVSPRGFRYATGAVLPRAALENTTLVAALQAADLRGHNGPHDYHAFLNAGVQFPITDTLQPLRVLVPGMGDYGLKAVERWALGKPSRPEYRDMVHYRGLFPVERSTTVSRCTCSLAGYPIPCHRQKKSTFEVAGRALHHLRWDIRVPRTEMVERSAVYSIREFVPGAVLEPIVWRPTKRNGRVSTTPAWWRGLPIPRWDAWLNYAGADAVSAAELADWMLRYKQDPRKVLDFPWVDSAKQ